MSPSVAAPSPASLRIYDGLRTAHLERLAVMEPAAMWYLDHRADFDESLVDPTNPPVRMSRSEVIRGLARRSHRAIELNEPAMVDQWKFLLAVVATVRARDLLTGNRTALTSYCIENADPTRQVVRRWSVPARVAPWLVRAVMRVLVHQTDRLAFGTDGARERYTEYVGARTLRRRSRLFEALPSPCTCPDGGPAPRRPEQVLFVGSFLERKGIVETMAAWDELHRRRPAANLRVIGAGRLLPEVEAWAEGRSDVRLDIDPPRAEVHAALRESSVLVLLSQPHGHWREQVGLPIVEALAHGCEVVTTSETGLASWLSAHGHEVLDPADGPELVASALSSALDRASERAGSLADLPDIDSRIAADHWMMTGRGDAGVPLTG